MRESETSFVLRANDCVWNVESGTTQGGHSIHWKMHDKFHLGLAVKKKKKPHGFLKK